jgi:cytochrome c
LRSLFLPSLILLAWQTYVPPPPPLLPEALSEKVVEQGKNLFERNVFLEEDIEIYNYLGSASCASCHDQPNRLNPKKLAQGFKDIRDRINREITEKMRGKELPPKDPAMEALVQYLVQRYKLQHYKLSK